MNYSFGDNRVINFFSKKENYKKYNTFKIWCKHYEPFLEDLFYEFVCICENNEIQIFTDDQTKQEFYFMLYNTSNGFLVDKNDFPYAYGLIQENENEDEDKNKNKEIKNIIEDPFIEDDFPSRI
jgi:hypothetical protein